MNVRLIFACLAAASAATAQQLTLETKSPQIAVVTVGSTVARRQEPPALLEPLGFVRAFVGPTFANITWNVGVTVEAALSCEITQMVSVSPLVLQPASAAVKVNDYLLRLDAPSGMAVQILAYQAFDVSPGAQQPLVKVDVFDDGQPEAVATTALSGPVQPLAVVTVGSQPLPIRISMSSLATAPGSHAGSLLRIEVAPFNQLAIDRVALGCGPMNDLLCVPWWTGNGVAFFADGALMPSVLALGLAPQPVLLPSFGAETCLLVPRPDAVLPLVGLGMPSTLALPAAVRPVTVYAQVVRFAQGSLRVTDAFRIIAN